MKKIKIDKDAIKTQFYKHCINKIIRVRITEVHKHEKLDSLFMKHDEDKKAIKESMRMRGFDKSHAIKCFIYNGLLYIDEGHTRYDCALECSLDYVWVYIEGEKTLEEAVKTTVEEQFNRRNVEDSDLVHLFIQLKAQGFSVSEISGKTHKSKRQLYKLQEILSKSDRNTISSLKNAEKRINEVYQFIKEQEKLAAEDAKNELLLQEQKKREAEESTIVVDENKVIGSLNQKEKDTFLERKRELDNREIELKEEKSKLSKLQNTKEILLAGVKFGVIGILKGLSVCEILNDSRLHDASDISKLIPNDDLNLLNSKLEEAVNG